MGRKTITNRTFNHAKMKKNPFLLDYSLKVMEVRKITDLNTVKRSEGIITDITATGTINNNFLVDITPNVKFYRVKAHLKELLECTGTALKLLIWIMFNVEKDKDYIVIDIADFKKYSGCSHTSYCTAIDNLTAMGVIMNNSGSNVFWINPAIFFYGNIIEKYAEYVHVVTVNTEEIKQKYGTDELK